MNAVSTNNVDNEMTKSVNDIANMPDLSEEERKQLIHVMERAKVRIYYNFFNSNLYFHL